MPAKDPFFVCASSFILTKSEENVTACYHAIKLKYQRQIYVIARKETVTCDSRKEEAFYSLLDFPFMSETEHLNFSRKISYLSIFSRSGKDSEKQKKDLSDIVLMLT